MSFLGVSHEALFDRVKRNLVGDTRMYGVQIGITMSRRDSSSVSTALSDHRT
jgi:hypothetical protein